MISHNYRDHHTLDQAPFDAVNIAQSPRVSGLNPGVIQAGDGQSRQKADVEIATNNSIKVKPLRRIFILYPCFG